MNEEQAQKIISLLQEIKILHATANDRQSKQLEISELLLARSNEQFEKASRIQVKAEALQDRAGKVLKWLIPFLTFAIIIALIQLARPYFN